MSVARCPEGHIYSQRRYGNICPYCSQTVLPTNRGIDPAFELDDGVFIDELEILNPVTGWLVCIEGPSKGRDYKIRTEKNFIGRSDGMDIQILGDNAIARKNHAVIVYDPKKRKTLLLPGDSHGLVYYNGDAIYGPVDLAPFDTIELGKSKFLFVPLCGENFEWPELENLAEQRQD